MSGYTILKADLRKDKEDVLDLLINNLDDQDLARYKWNYEYCPLGYAPCWLAKHEKSDRFIGTTAVYPRKVFVNGVRMNTGLIAGFGVDKSHRVFGPAIPMQKEILSQMESLGLHFLYEAPNLQSRLVFLRVGYKKIAQFKKYIKILRTEHISKEYLLNSFMKNKYSSLMKFILKHKFLLKLIDVFIIIASKEKRYRKKFKYSVETPESFDKRFDTFWNNVSKEHNIIGVRTSELLNWRYSKAPIHEYHIFCILDGKKEILGYIVYYLRGNRYYVADMLYYKREGILNALLAEFALFARSNKIGAIIIHHLGNKLVSSLKKFNYILIKKQDGEILVYSPDPELESFLTNESYWHFFEGDVDV
jgi:hypothetical protein